MKVPFVNLSLQFESIEKELVDTFLRVGKSGHYVMGPDVDKFELELADICQVEHVITVGNGTDALELILQAYDIGPGDEVITVPNSFIASAGAINAVGAKIVFVDVADDFNIDVNAIVNAITPATKAIIPVHLTGNPANMTEINRIAKQHHLKVIEDAAQAIGAKHCGKAVGSLGDAAAFSLHPLKNFHLLGDAGFISTKDSAFAKRIRRLRNHGLANRDESIEWGRNSRLDTMQAAFGLVKLKYFSDWTKRFQGIANIYSSELEKIVSLPKIPQENSAVFHNYVIQVDDRAKLMAYLDDKGIGSKIHYPIPLHLMECSAGLGYELGDFPSTEKQSEKIVSLPIYPELTDEQVYTVCQQIKAFYRV
jgi:dTDP-4-amino-4,6-dideoxygalactose transaminase